MISFWSWLLFVGVVIGGAVGELDTDICDLVTESYGPIPPTLPENFEIEGEVVSHQDKTKYWELMYYDNMNLRAKYVRLARGIEYHLLYDYNAAQILKYIILHPGAEITEDYLSLGCKAVDMESAPERFIFGFRDGSLLSKHSKMYDANRVLRFGGPYPYAFNGTDSLEDRGMKTNTFYGCVYESELEQTSVMRYNFSGDDIVPAGAMMKSQIDGTDTLEYESIPIGLESEGVRYEFNATGSRMPPIYFKNSRSFSWFIANPTFNEIDFQIPEWMHCDNYRGGKELPKYPKAFSVRMEMTAFSEDILGKKVAMDLTSVDQVYYDYEKNLARRDFTPTRELDPDILKKFGNLGRVKTVYDFNTGALFTIHIATGRCFSRAIEHGDFFESTADSLGVHIATPEELFQVEEENMEYKGQYFFRDINCDAWSTKVTYEDLNVTIVKEMLMSTNGWHFEAEEKVEFGIPVRQTNIVDNLGKEVLLYVVESNFFKFKASPPPLTTYDISACAETMAHEFYVIKLNFADKTAEESILTYTWQFLEVAQDYLTIIGQLLSPLRIQRRSIQDSRADLYLSFAITDKPDLNAKIPDFAKGPTIKEAVNSIQKVIQARNFRIDFTDPSSQSVAITASPGSFFQRFPSGKALSVSKIEDRFGELPSEQASHLDSSQQDASHHDFTDRHNWVLYDDPKPKKEGMKSGAFAGLAIAMLLIGIAIGIAGMYFYIRKTYGTSMDDGIAMQKQTP